MHRLIALCSNQDGYYYYTCVTEESKNQIKTLVDLSKCLLGYLMYSIK